MSPKVCASVTGTSLAEIANMVKSAEREGADLVEVRFDYLSEARPKPRELQALTSLPMIATCRLPSQGGLFQGHETDRRQMLLDAAASNFNLVDLEMDTPQLGQAVQQLRSAGAKIILSWHSTSPLLPDEVKSRYNDMKQTKPDVYKIVMTAHTISDNLTCLSFVSEASQEADVVCFCMGPLGAASRILSPVFGGAFTYASIVKGREAAPGQLTVSETKKIYRLLGV
ncbi:type I 3-dehydroquinate dehydratase [Candidatus Bathyarchaeota archaeon]|nr:type I 3-dehydroquinate dehydratase [Candidatus Bathyarchaeota archaeon]